jgi:glycosyltransferase involved in cell wall biosynthesis
MQLATEEVRSSADARLLVPAEDVANPEVSIVVPALNEQLTVGTFVEWCRQGLDDAGVVGEILIVDSSTDQTAEIALSRGARVLKVPRRGLGQGYIDALPFIRGRFVIMGDADCTYDFRQLKPFIERFRAGDEFVMGSRFKGYIEPGAMPRLHRYLGTPVTTWILNRVFSSHFSDIHCGMRGITRDALLRMDLQSASWEYASEMVLKSVRMQLDTSEVPVTFLRDPPGRVSHHRRIGWFSPWQAAWINLRAMFTYGADFFVYKPGLVLLAIGLIITLPLTFGAISIGPVTFSLFWSLAGLTTAVLGLQTFFLGCLAQSICDPTGQARHRWLRVFSYNRSVLVSLAAVLGGMTLASFLVVQYIDHGLRLPSIGATSYRAVTGLLLMILGFVLFANTLLLHALELRLSARPSIGPNGSRQDA